jgi:hypothetical protein
VGRGERDVLVNDHQVVDVDDDDDDAASFRREECPVSSAERLPLR